MDQPLVENGQEFLDRIAEQDYSVALMAQILVLDDYEATKKLRQQEGDQR
ncbi:MAG: hypothetical protein ACFBSC_02010 [Microcoleaceae cyanobacterium]